MKTVGATIQFVQDTVDSIYNRGGLSQDQQIAIKDELSVKLETWFATLPTCPQCVENGWRQAAAHAAATGGTL